jgi:hypothetical protein
VAITYPLVVYYDSSSASKLEALLRRDCAGRLKFVDCAMPGIHARDARGRSWTGIAALEAAYRAAWDGEVSL